MFVDKIQHDFLLDDKVILI